MGVSKGAIPWSDRRIPIYTVADDHVGGFYARGSWYEHDLLSDLARKHQIPPGIAVDVGAYIGGHSVFFAEVLGRAVVAYEPILTGTSDAAEALRSNAADRRKPIRLRPMALGATHERVAIVPPPPRGNAGMSQVRADAAGDVVQTTLDLEAEAGELDLPDEPRRVGLIKIDVEGAECDVLAGAARTIGHDRPLVVVEAATATALGRVDQFFAGRGYRRHPKRYGRTPTYVWAPRILPR